MKYRQASYRAALATPPPRPPPVASANSLDGLPVDRQRSHARRELANTLDDSEYRQRELTKLCKSDAYTKNCSGCRDKKSRRYNRRCYLHLLECISYRVYERIFFDGNLPNDLQATARAFQSNPREFFESNPVLTLSIGHRLNQHALSSPHPVADRQNFRMKHIAPLVDLFKQLVECAPPHVQAVVQAKIASGEVVPPPSTDPISAQNFPPSFSKAPPPPTRPMAKKVSIRKSAWNQRIETAYPEIGSTGITTDKGRVVLLANRPIGSRGDLKNVWRGLRNGWHVMVFG